MQNNQFYLNNGERKKSLIEQRSKGNKARDVFLSSSLLMLKQV